MGAENGGIGEFGSATESCSPEDEVPDYITISVGCDSPTSCTRTGRPYAFSHHMSAKQVFKGGLEKSVQDGQEVFDEVGQPPKTTNSRLAVLLPNEPAEGTSSVNCASMLE